MRFDYAFATQRELHRVLEFAAVQWGAWGHDYTHVNPSEATADYAHSLTR